MPRIGTGIMKALRVLAVALATIKLLVAVPYLFMAVISLVPNLVIAGSSKRDTLIALSILLGAIGLGYPFSLIRTKKAVSWVIVIFSAIPLCSTMFLLPMGDLDAWATRAVALLLPVLALADYFLSRKLQTVPGRLSFVTRTLTVGCTVLSLAVVIGAALYISSRGRPYQPPSFAFQGDSKDLHQSVVVPILDTPMPKGENVVWCATLQLAWDHLGKDVLHQPPHVQGAEAVASRLNASQLAEDDLPPESYLATAGFAKDGVVEKVKSEMKRRFQKEVQIDTLQPNDVLAYAYLEANAAFTIPFFDKRGPLRFKGPDGQETKVAAFGIEEKHEYAYRALRAQIGVLYALRKTKSEALGEFALDLCRDSSPNQIVIACVPPKATLLETLKDVEKKTQDFAGNSDPAFMKEFGIRDVLLVPNLNWEVRHDFPELEGDGKRFLNAGFEGYYIAKAMQTIRFKLDRSGAELASEAQMPCKPMATHFVCDRPFLIFVKKRGAERPFFVMWVDNAELLCKP